MQGHRGRCGGGPLRATQCRLGLRDQRCQLGPEGLRRAAPGMPAAAFFQLIRVGWGRYLVFVVTLAMVAPGAAGLASTFTT